MKKGLFLTWGLSVFFWMSASPALTETILIPSKYESINRPSPVLVFSNPFIQVESEHVQGVICRVDGDVFQHCSLEDRDVDRLACGKPKEIDSGPHILEVTFCTDASCNLGTGSRWQSDIRFVVGARERVTIDLQKLAFAEGSNEEISKQAISRATRMGKERSPCVQAVEEAFYANTCTAAGMGLFREKLASMDRVCRADWIENTEMLFELALWQTAFLHPNRCYKSEELKKLPGFLSGFDLDRFFWPKGTLKQGMGSWWWARSMEGYETEDKELRSRADTLVATWQERQGVIDQLIAALIDPEKGLGALLESAQKLPWDTNPIRPAGHRIYALMLLAGAGGHPFQRDRRVAAFLAHGAASDQRLHCGSDPEARGIVGPIVDDGVLSEEEWQVVQQLIKRTPQDASLDACEPVFQGGLKGISQDERLSILASADCAPSRNKDYSGRVLRSLLNPTRKVMSEELRLKYSKQYRNCIAP